YAAHRRPHSFPTRRSSDLGALSASGREGRAALVINISSDAAVTPYPKWGAYGASKAALRHLTGIWNQELSVEGVRFLSFDPGDMDTPMHALAVPDEIGRAHV